MNEKQFARYLRAVRRRLTLPKKMKDRAAAGLRVPQESIAIHLPRRSGACSAGWAFENRHEFARFCVHRCHRRRGRADRNFHCRTANF